MPQGFEYLKISGVNGPAHKYECTYVFPSRLLRCKISSDGNLSSETGPASEQNANYLLKAQLTMLMVMLMLVCFPACLFLMIVTEARVLKLCT